MPIAAILLAAGYATRLYPLTQDRPKSLLPLGGQTILDAVWEAIDDVAEVRQRILVSNHRFAAQFQAWQHARGVDVTVIDDGTDTPETRLGAIRDLALARRSVDPRDDLLVLGTDNLFRWSLAEFVAQAQRHRPAPAIAVGRMPSKADATRFGVVVRDSASRITEFVEKSPRPPSTDAALCVYYFPAAMGPAIQQFLEAGGNADAPGYFIQWLVQRGAVYGVVMPGAWYDIGTVEAYQAVIKEWTSVPNVGGKSS